MLKHRKRKEKVVRKLDAMPANLGRLTDLTTELRRQLKPLGRQAEMARRAATIQADLRDARLRLAADDLVRRQAEFNDTNQAETTLRREHDELDGRLDAATVSLRPTSRRFGLSERAEAAQQTWFRLSALAERVSVTRPASRPSGRSSSTPNQDRHGRRSRGPRRRGQRDRGARTAAARRAGRVAEPLQAARTELTERERVAAEAERAHLAAVRAEADRREGLARLRPGGHDAAPASNPSTRRLRGCRWASTRPRP